MSQCTTDCRATTGARFEHCLVCHRTFGGHALGDAHRVKAGSYVLAKPTTRSRPSTVQRFPTVDDVPKKWVIVSESNTVFRCLSLEEMQERGWRETKGVWRGPKQDNPWWEKDDVLEGADDEVPVS